MTSPRRATAADARLVADLVESAYSPYIDLIGRPPAPMLDDYDDVLANAEVWVVAGDHRLRGCLVLVPRRDHLFLDNIAVHPDDQGHGVGTALLHLADRRAQELGVTEIRLYTNVLMTQNRAYYARHGYVETHTTVDEGYDRAFFTRRVPPS
jgi:N-acetylglutamate synthase-like GNAT family acetyltransferase